MFLAKDYSVMTLDELISEEKAMKSGTIATAFVIGMLVGVAVWAAVGGKFLLTIGLLGAAMFVGNKNSKARKAIQTEIQRRKSVG
ncbi:hypothetical protein ACAW74_00270 [Fibrella sp. WM1]|uniref:hypothetical protein n=1 Tax=Fibrella musci TaxID=3242485 RepID=UPI0035202CEB